jgi:hypothetical protein
VFLQAPIQLPPAPAPQSGSAPPAAAPQGQAGRQPAEDVAAYGQYVASALKDLDRGLVALDAQTAKARDNPSSVRDPKWKEATTLAIAVTRSAGEELRNYSDPIPPSLRELGETLSALGDDAAGLADQYEAALDVEDPAKVAEAGRAGAAIGARRNAATVQVQALGFG